MKQNHKTLFAIYKNDIHLGNSYGLNQVDAIEHYLLASYQIQFKDIQLDEILKFQKLNQYKAIQAIANIHYTKSKHHEETTL